MGGALLAPPPGPAGRSAPASLGDSQTKFGLIPSERSDPARLRAGALGTRRPGAGPAAAAAARGRMRLGGSAGGLWEEGGGGGERRGRRGGRSVFTQRRAGADAEPGAAAARWSWRISWRISG